MKTLDIHVPVTVYQMHELPQQLSELIQQAKAATQHSYSPYSHFAVGAAVLLEDGQIFSGANQENAAYPSGLCAERTTLFYANARCPKTPVVALAIAGFSNGCFTPSPVSPCGACRQVMLETEDRFNHNIQVLLYGEREIYLFQSAKDLLPYSFVSDNLNENAE